MKRQTVLTGLPEIRQAVLHARVSSREQEAEAAYRTGDFDAVEALLIEALRQSEAEGDRASEAAALDQLGELQHFRTIERPRDEWPGVDHGPERERFERALAIRRELGDRAGVAESLLHLGWVHQVLLSDGATALPLFREALELAEPEAIPRSAPSYTGTSASTSPWTRGGRRPHCHTSRSRSTCGDRAPSPPASSTAWSPWLGANRWRASMRPRSRTARRRSTS